MELSHWRGEREIAQNCYQQGELESDDAEPAGQHEADEEGSACGDEGGASGDGHGVVSAGDGEMSEYGVDHGVCGDSLHLRFGAELDAMSERGKSKRLDVVGGDIVPAGEPGPGS